MGRCRQVLGSDKLERPVLCSCCSTFAAHNIWQVVVGSDKKLLCCFLNLWTLMMLLLILMLMVLCWEDHLGEAPIKKLATAAAAAATLP